jgi:hypothetical protein
MIPQTTTTCREGQAVGTSKQSNYNRYSPPIEHMLQHRVGSFFAIRNRVRVTVLKGARA